MSDDACPLPEDSTEDVSTALRRMLRAKRIAVVGLSDDPSRASYGVAQYLIRAGKQVIPINPNHESVMGLKCFPSLEEVAGPIELVDVFRRPQFCPDVVRAAIAAGAKGVWLQSGIRSPEARKLAREAGIDYVEDRCLMVELMHTSR